FGLTVPQGIGKLGELRVLVDADETFPEKARKAVRGLFDHCVKAGLIAYRTGGAKPYQSAEA
ncbi:hypothetical protein, partial [Methyloceanibacter sp.]|uniref:hypothetical protein n=1 Tax=Methyloceanibacter sp. TaxID=1965321 RepID=UPI00351BC395